MPISKKYQLLKVHRSLYLLQVWCYHISYAIYSINYIYIFRMLEACSKYSVKPKNRVVIDPLDAFLFQFKRICIDIF